MSEQDIQKSILDYLNFHGVAVKTGSGALKTQDGRFVKLTTGFNNGRGWFDIVFIYKGNVYLIEVKAPYGRLSDDQVFVHEAVKKHSVKPYILHSLDEAIEMLKEINETQNN